MDVDGGNVAYTIKDMQKRNLVHFVYSNCRHLTNWKASSYNKNFMKSIKDLVIECCNALKKRSVNLNDATYGDRVLEYLAKEGGGMLSMEGLKNIFNTKKALEEKISNSEETLETILMGREQKGDGSI